ncbi:F-box/LRR-repeat protein At3g48880 [Coffea arabica]|uniref:F-box/LRR-repeat protein At3g48880 n=1 Tax=Coffea arabica TaxID=13443 RepID=A0A6P6U054_COFAR|nr:F-box/LRR-repeat protein At3g48880-like [Coffea arabica]
MENSAVASRTTEEAGENFRDWSKLQTDMLLKIFALVSVMDRILNVSAVCHSWRSACSHKILSSTLDTSEIRNEMDTKTRRGRTRLMVILICGVNLAGENLTTLIIDSILEVNDKILTRAAKRCPNLMCLGLLWPYRATSRGLRTAFESWTNLQSMSISFNSLLSHVNIFKAIGQNCPNFTELKVHAPFVSQETAQIASQFIPHLKVLRLQCKMVSKDAAVAVLDGLQDLEELYISIQKVEYVAPVTGVFRPAIMRDPRVLSKASRLRVYHVCYAGECSSCPASSMGPPPSNVV